MTDKKTGGPAFPVPGFEFMDDRDPTKPERVAYIPYAGMALRDYFAAKALNALLADAPRGTSFGVDHMDTNMNYALAAYAIADAMLEARND